MLYQLFMPCLGKGSQMYHRKRKLLLRFLSEGCGYTKEEIKKFDNIGFHCAFARHLTLEDVRLLAQPFIDNGIDDFPCLAVEGDSDEYISYDEAGLHMEPHKPKRHYYDKPVISREQLVDPEAEWELQLEKLRKLATTYPRSPQAQPQPRSTELTVTCPYCKSTNVKKIDVLSRTVSASLWGLGSKKIGKQWHCNSCGSDF